MQRHLYIGKYYSLKLFFYLWIFPPPDVVIIFGQKTLYQNNKSLKFKQNMNIWKYMVVKTDFFLVIIVKNIASVI